MDAPLAIWTRAIAVIAASLFAEVAGAQVWSPDGKRLAWPSADGVALLDVDAGRATAVLGGYHRDATCAWSDDGSLLIVAGTDASGARLELIPASGGEPRHVRCAAISGQPTALAVIGGRAFVAGDAGLVRVDLENGEVTSALPGRYWSLQRRGPRLWCTLFGDGTNDSPKAGAMLVLRGDVTEEIVHVTTGEDSGIGGVAWRPDGTALYVGIECNPGSRLGWYLREVPLDGGAQRETCLEAGASCLCDGASWMESSPTVAPSPDGRFVAMQCWVGLFLVDVKDAARRVTKIPFPEAVPSATR